MEINLISKEDYERFSLKQLAQLAREGWTLEMQDDIGIAWR